MQDRKEKHLYAERVRESLMLASCQCVAPPSTSENGLEIPVNEWDFTAKVLTTTDKTQHTGLVLPAFRTFRPTYSYLYPRRSVDSQLERWLPT